MSTKRLIECPYCERSRNYRSYQEFESHLRSCDGVSPMTRRKQRPMTQPRLFAFGSE